MNTLVTQFSNPYGNVFGTSGMDVPASDKQISEANGAAQLTALAQYLASVIPASRFDSVATGTTQTSPLRPPAVSSAAAASATSQWLSSPATGNDLAASMNFIAQAGSASAPSGDLASGMIESNAAAFAVLASVLQALLSGSRADAKLQATLSTASLNATFNSANEEIDKANQHFIGGLTQGVTMMGASAFNAAKSFKASSMEHASFNTNKSGQLNAERALAEEESQIDEGLHSGVTQSDARQNLPLQRQGSGDVHGTHEENTLRTADDAIAPTGTQALPRSANEGARSADADTDQSADQQDSQATPAQDSVALDASNKQLAGNHAAILRNQNQARNRTEADAYRLQHDKVLNEANGHRMRGEAIHSIGSAVAPIAQSGADISAAESGADAKRSDASAKALSTSAEKAIKDQASAVDQAMKLLSMIMEILATNIRTVSDMSNFKA